jgi:hypothetical protein
MNLVKKWEAEMKPGFPVVHDKTGEAAMVFDIQEGIPHNVVVDRTGKVLGTVGADIPALEKLVAKAVPATRPAARRSSAR